MKSNLLSTIWRAARVDLLLGLAFIPFYSAAELSLGALLTFLTQLIFVPTPRVQLEKLLPEGFRALISFGQTLDRKDLAVTIPALICLVGLIKLFANFMGTYLVERAGHRVAHTLRRSMLSGYLQSSGNMLDKKNPDEVANQILVDTGMLQNAVSRGLLTSLRDALVVLGCIAAIFTLATKAVLVAAAILVPLIFAVMAISKVFSKFARESASRQVALATRTLQARNGLVWIFGLRTQWREREDFSAMANSYYDFVRQSFFVRMFFRPGTEFFAISLLALMLLWRFRAAESFDAATWSGLFIFVALMFRPLKNIANFIAQMSEVRVVVSRINTQWKHFGDTSLPNRNFLKAAERPWALRAKNVTYRAASGQIILNNCSLEVKRGKRIAFVGRSGSGKTTFLRVCAGLLTPEIGTVEIEKSHLMATQTPYVFRGQIAENILYDQTHLAPEVAEAKIQDFLLNLGLAFSPAGAAILAKKRLGYLGDGLSGGEKARVALSRILLAQPSLILLDEPTANLDAESSRLFWEAVRQWQQRDSENTVIAVMHLIDDPKLWDECFLFADGQVLKQISATEAMELMKKETT